MNNNVSSIQSPKLIGAMPIVYEPKNLLDPSRSEAAAAYFSQKHLTSAQKKQLLEEIIDEKMEAVLDIFIKHKLIDAADIKQNSDRNDSWIVEYFSKKIVESLENRDELRIGFLLNCGLLDKAIEQFSSCFSKKSLEELLKGNKLSSEHLNSLYKQNQASVLFEILDTALFDSTKSVIEVFKKSTVLKEFIVKVFQEENVRLVKKLAESQLIVSEGLKQALLESATFHQLLKAELGALCNRPSQNKNLILFFLLAGVTFDPADVSKVAQSGDYELLQAFQDRGADVVEPVFLLIVEGKIGALEQLLRNNKGCFLDPNLKNSEDNTLLIEAVIRDQFYCVQRLLENGANPLIRNSNHQNVFDLLTGKSQAIAKLLYNPKSINVHIYNSKQVQQKANEEESALMQLLKKKAKGNPIANYYALFVKTHETFMALLKSSPFNQQTIEQSGISSMLSTNQICCWTSFNFFPVPEEYKKDITLMETLAFAIIQADSLTPEEEEVKIDAHRYTLISLQSDYKSRNAEDRGFKYSYKELITHGHGKNPQAAYSALKKHKDAIKLSNWPAAPDLRAEQETLTESSQNLSAMFQKEDENDGKLEDLTQRIDDFVQKADSIIHARYATNFDDYTKQQENAVIKQDHDSIKEELKNITLYSFNERRLEEWQIAIRSQIKALQELDLKLQSSKYIKNQELEIEKKSITNHLESLKDIIAENSVTSAEVPTIKIYRSSILIKDVFNSSDEHVHAVKKEMCRLIGSSLQKIPSYEHIVGHLLDLNFRNCILEQFESEAQFIVNDAVLPVSQSMQVLAADLAILKDTSKILATIPPIAHRFGEDDPLLEVTMFRHLSHYVSARRTLDLFWAEVCDDRAILDQKLERILELLSQRFFLMDEEIRVASDETNKVGPQNYYYPSIDDTHPKRMLDEQLFLLQTSLLFSLQGAVKTPTIEKIIIGVQLRFVPSFHGIEKTKYNFDGLFLPHLVGVLRQIKSIAGVASQSNSMEGNIFKPLNDMLSSYEVPKKEDIEHLLRKFLQDLSKSNPIPTLPNSVLQLILIVRQTYPIIHALKISDKNLQSVHVQKKVQENLDEVMTIIDELKFAEGPKVSMVNLWEILNNKGDLTQDKESLKGELVAQFKVTLKKNLIQLKQLIKSLKFDEVNAEQARNAQIQFKECNESIHQYLSCRNPSSTSQVDFAASKEEFIKKITIIMDLFETSEMKTQVEKCRRSLEKIAQTNVVLNTPDTSTESSQMILDVIGLCKFLTTTKYLKNPSLLTALKSELYDLAKPCLEECLQMLLNNLTLSIDDCQSLLHDSHVKKLQQISVNLRLGIREQIYYTAEKKNVSYFLWDGKPFDDVPYHTDNEVHIPLVADRWSLKKRSREFRQLFLDQGDSEGKDPLHATRIADKK